ncbi:alanine racemase [Paraphotobacterium marinum]
MLIQTLRTKYKLMNNRTEITIDLKAIAQNIKRIKVLAPNSKILSVVKSNAYGHGLENVTSSIEYLIDAFGVARIEEALLLRASGIKKRILLLEGFLEKSELYIIDKEQLSFVVHNLEQLELLSKFRFIYHKPQVWIKVDTGMNRLGINECEVEQFFEVLNHRDDIIKPIVLMSHFSCADHEDRHFTQRQLSRFMKQLTLDKCQRSIANSAGILFYPESQLDWIRPGIIQYGLSPQENSLPKFYKLEPAMELSATLISIKKVKKDQPVGYGATWKTPEDTYLGVISIGYGDGYPREANSNTPVFINNRLVYIAGRVSMDMTTVNLGPKLLDKIGDKVILWGPQLPIEIVAKSMNTINYELVTKLTTRPKLIFKN